MLLAVLASPGHGHGSCSSGRVSNGAATTRLLLLRQLTTRSFVQAWVALLRGHVRSPGDGGAATVEGACSLEILKVLGTLLRRLASGAGLGRQASLVLTRHWGGSSGLIPALLAHLGCEEEEGDDDDSEEEEGRGGEGGHSHRGLMPRRRRLKGASLKTFSSGVSGLSPGTAVARCLVAAVETIATQGDPRLGRLVLLRSRVVRRLRNVYSAGMSSIACLV